MSWAADKPSPSWQPSCGADRDAYVAGRRASRDRAPAGHPRRGVRDPGPDGNAADGIAGDATVTIGEHRATLDHSTDDRRAVVDALADADRLLRERDLEVQRRPADAVPAVVPTVAREHPRPASCGAGCGHRADPAG